MPRKWLLYASFRNLCYGAGKSSWESGGVSWTSLRQYYNIMVFSLFVWRALWECRTVSKVAEFVYFIQGFPGRCLLPLTRPLMSAPSDTTRRGSASWRWNPRQKSFKPNPNQDLLVSVCAKNDIALRGSISWRQVWNAYLRDVHNQEPWSPIWNLKHQP